MTGDRRAGPRSMLALALLAAALAGGCSRDRLRTMLTGNQRPTVTLTQAPTASGSPSFYAYEMRWTGDDPDGTVDHYLYCVDPPTATVADTPWVFTRTNRQVLVFRSDDPDSAGTRARPGGFHVFVLKAVDDRGASSPPAVAAFFTFTVAPTVQIVQPYRVSGLVVPLVPPAATFRWTGTDPDGLTSRKPVYYRWHLFPEGGREFDYATLLLHPDDLRARYAPAFAGWDSVSGDTCRVTVGGMTPGQEAVLAVVAFDEAGAYTPVFSFDGNLLRFECTFSGSNGPRLSVWNESFSYTYPSGSYSTDPLTFPHIEVPGGRTVYFNWSGVAMPGASMLGYRWAMDLASIDDPTPRSDEATDWTHWSASYGSNTHCALGPFPGTPPDSLEQHILYIEAEDTNHLKSLAAIQFRVLRPAPTRPLLFVDDTRFTPDRAAAGHPDSVTGPAGLWPSAAELDTFLFARGGVRWRCYVPTTTRSSPGIFAGYDFDTLGTRALGAGGISLATLSRYRNVVWLADPAVDFASSIDNPRSPMPLLRYLSMPSRLNTLLAYSRMGGGTWLMGGGIAYNSLLPWNVTSNDVPSSIYPPPRTTLVFSQAAGELVPGRLIYDTAHWRSQVVMADAARAPRYPAGARPAGGPDFSLLPAELKERTPATDPMPPMRNLPFQFYQTTYPAEIMNRGNVVPGLDTLYRASTCDSCVVMTWYHGPDISPSVLSGFPLWYFQRAQAIQVGDFVLQQLWHMTRAPVAR